MLVVHGICNLSVVRIIDLEMREKFDFRPAYLNVSKVVLQDVPCPLHNNGAISMHSHQ